MNVNMEKENKQQADTMSVSTISNGGYNYESPPPAYQSKKSTAVALAKIAATTILAAAFILGAFIVAASYISSLNKCNCPDVPTNPEHHVTSRKLPQAAAFVGLQQDAKHDVLSKIQEKPKMKEEKEISIPIAVTTTTTESPEPEDIPDNVFGDEEATEEEVPIEEEEAAEEDVQQRVMDLLKKMVQIDPSMRGNMKCRVSKQKMMPIEARGVLPNKPVLQVHCTKTVVRPISSPISPFGRGPQLVRIPPMATSGLIRMARPLPLNGLPNFPAPDIPHPPGLFNKPQTPDLKIPMMLKLLSNLPLLQGPHKSLPIRRLDNGPFSPLDDNEEEDVPPFPFFPERKIIPLGNVERSPNPRFMIPLRKKEPLPMSLPINDILNEAPQKVERRIIKLPFPFLNPPKQSQGFSPRILPFGKPMENEFPQLPNKNLVPPKLENNQDFGEYPAVPSSFNDEEESEGFPFFRAPEPPQQRQEHPHPVPFLQGPPPPEQDEPQPFRFVQVPPNEPENEQQPLDFLKPPQPQQEQNPQVPIPFFRAIGNQEDEEPIIPLFHNPQHINHENPESQPPPQFFPLPESPQNSQQPIPVPVETPFFLSPNQEQTPVQSFPNEQYAPEFNAPDTEEKAPPAPENPVVIPLRREEPFPPPSLAIPNPLSIIDRIKSLQNIPVPQPVSPRTYHLNKHTIPETDKRGGQPPVEISPPQQ